MGTRKSEESIKLPPLDWKEAHYHIRRLDNMFRVTCSEHMTNPERFYVSVEKLCGSHWEHVAGSSIGLVDRETANRLIVEKYAEFKPRS